MRRFWLQGVKEPLIQFMGLGVVVFLVYWLTYSDSRAIEIQLSDSDRTVFIEQFERDYGRSPNTMEIREFLKRWVKEEVLYREGIAMGFHEHDPFIRQRVIKKMQLTLVGSEDVAKPTESELKHFLESNKERYTSPQQYSFEWVMLDKRIIGPDLSADRYHEMMIEALGNGAQPELMGLTVNREVDRPAAYIKGRFGSEFISSLNEISRSDSWMLVRANLGPILVRKLTIAPASVPELSAVRARLVQDWKKNQRIQAVEQKVTQLLERYKIYKKNMEPGTIVAD